MKSSMHPCLLTSTRRRRLPTAKPSPANQTAITAFTRADLVALLGVGTVLAVLLQPSLGGNRMRADLAFCLGNFRQLSRAWTIYTEDNNGRLPGNLDGGESLNSQNKSRTWAIGWLDPSSYTPDNTNTANLTGAQLGRYVDSVSVFRCPSDPSLNRGRTGVPRVRSVSMNAYMGERSAPFSPGYQQFTTLAAISTPSPAKAFVFAEEHEGSINDGYYVISMDGYEPANPGVQYLYDVPADWHDGSGALSFADGHVEDWRWVDPRTRRPHQPGIALSLGLNQPGNADLRRLQSAATSRIIPLTPAAQ